MVWQRALLFERLKVVETMRVFVSHHLGGGEELCSRLERVEIDLTAVRKTAEDGTEALKLAKRERKSF